MAADGSVWRSTSTIYRRTPQFVIEPKFNTHPLTARLMDPSLSLWTLFASSFLAATLLPGGSEFVLYGVVTMYPDQKWLAIGIATLGNTLGGLTSYAIGRLVPQPKRLTSPARGDPQARRSRALETLRRYGAAALLLSWVPFVGDPLCVAAGWLRLNVVLATVFMATGKFARYVMISTLAA